MRFLTRVSVGLVILLASIAFAPAIKADPIVIHAGGFSLTNLGNNGGGVNGFDMLIGAASSSSHNVTGPGSFGAVLNLLTFKTAFTGPGSGGITDFNFSQDITINGVTKTLNMAGHISIGHLVDNVTIFESGPLTFNFNTFSVTMNVFPTNVDGFGKGDTYGSLKAEFEVRNTNPIPEPATISLLGLGLAGVAAKLRKRRRSRALQSANVAKTT
jgi:hypothetical protein